ncbi:uncharacterized protein LOC111717762, partial [Eurytemora carolleeae]|uniref:uncharacterized protein LOC111717762 n=1 Tax=Eurytemora carolleeae TaxID=1294199 RepID=UPI000C7704E5
MFDLYYLGDKYELRGARNLIKEVVSSFKINQENWIHVLKGIKKYENTFLFEDLCNILQDQVQGYLKGCPSSDEYLDDIQESDDTDFYSWVKNWIQKWRRSDTGLQEADRKDSQESELKDLKIQIQNSESQHEELIKNAELKLGIMKEMKGKADFKVVNPVCPGGCGDNISLENMFEHIDSCSYMAFDEIHLKLNTEV